MYTTFPVTNWLTGHKTPTYLLPVTKVIRTVCLFYEISLIIKYSFFVVVLFCWHDTEGEVISKIYFYCKCNLRVLVCKNELVLVV